MGSSGLLGHLQARGTRNTLRHTHTYDLNKNRSWRGGSVVENTCYFCRGSRGIPSTSTMASHFTTGDSVSLIASSGLCRCRRYMVHSLRAGKTTHIHKIKMYRSLVKWKHAVNSFYSVDSFFSLFFFICILFFRLG